MADREYDNLRIKSPTHVRSGYGGQISSGGGQQIFFRQEPYPHFVVLPKGIEVPLENVSSAIPKAAGLASKLRRTGAKKVEPDAAE